MEKNISLKNKNTFRIGGNAKYYAEVDSKEEFLKAFKEAQKLNIPVFIIGEGSNLLVSDNGFDGLVIKLNLKEIAARSNILSAEAGAYLRDLVFKAKELNLGGIEWAVGIPGTIGGAIFGNAGVPNHSISDLVKEVEVFNGEEIVKLKKEDCHFSYRNSIFKKNNSLVILKAKFEFEKGENVEDKMRDYLAKRKIIKGYSIGSIFKNPQGYSAGKLIDECGLKGEKIGDAMISSEHGNWIINLGNAKSKDVEALIVIIKGEVKKKFDIDLEEEIRRL
ncbi:MAG: UDP-N-acetylmuramate dehydrogenase [Candidatus Pacebacteria bacterium]|nr:UDP-N-acetylmuramate dehydrogenase [Candidatus Paceibacterota bacterium]